MHIWTKQGNILQINRSIQFRINNVWSKIVIAWGEKSFNLKCAYIYSNIHAGTCEMTLGHIIIVTDFILSMCRRHSIYWGKILKKECNHMDEDDMCTYNCQSLFCVLVFVRLQSTLKRKISKIMHVFPINICCLFYVLVVDVWQAHQVLR